jgi:hypothetical protein
MRAVLELVMGSTRLPSQRDVVERTGKKEVSRDLPIVCRRPGAYACEWYSRKRVSLSTVEPGNIGTDSLCTLATFDTAKAGDPQLKGH